ncbi:MAG: hypothetical protein JO256_08985 [Alphaproteobacteria bacterium]|nr:hypothetical protein [Alphaproteobacteria bacterium]
MTKMTLAATLLAFSAAAAWAQSGSTNAYSSADEAKAKAAVTAAGFTPGTVATAQAGNLYLSASKGADKYFVTVTADGHVYPGQPLGSVPTVPAASMQAPPGTPIRAGGGGRGPFSGGD